MANAVVQERKGRSDTFRPVYKLHARLRGHTQEISVVKFSPDGSLLASASADGQVMLWSVEEEELACSLIGHKAGISDIDWSADGNTLVSASDDHTLILWDVINAKEKRVLHGHKDMVFCVAYNRKSPYIASGSFDCNIFVWDAQTGKRCSILSGHTDLVTAVDFHIKQQHLVSCGRDGFVRLWDWRTGMCFKQSNPSLEMAFVKYAPNGTYLLYAGYDHKLILCEHEPMKVRKTYEGHVNNKFCVNADFVRTVREKMIASGSEDGKVYLWDLNTKELLQRLEGHEGIVVSVTCHPTDHMIASAAITQTKHTIILWRGEMQKVPDYNCNQY